MPFFSPFYLTGMQILNSKGPYQSCNKEQWAESACPRLISEPVPKASFSLTLHWTDDSSPALAHLFFHDVPRESKQPCLVSLLLLLLSWALPCFLSPALFFLLLFYYNILSQYVIINIVPIFTPLPSLAQPTSHSQNLIVSFLKNIFNFPRFFLSSLS